MDTLCCQTVPCSAPQTGDTSVKMGSRPLKVFSAMLALLLGTLGSPCCVLPLVVQVLGFGVLSASSVAIVSSYLSHYRPHLIGFSVLFLSMRIWLDYRLPSAHRSWKFLVVLVILIPLLSMMSHFFFSVGQIPDEDGSRGSMATLSTVHGFQIKNTLQVDEHDPTQPCH